jgi:hypothetical protein
MIRPLYSTPDNPDRDLIGKRADYAEGRIPEYWIVDPRDESITVLTFPPDGGDDAEYGVFRAGEQASSNAARRIRRGRERDVRRDPSQGEISACPPRDFRRCT